MVLSTGVLLGSYVFTRSVSYLCTRPGAGERLETVRNKLADVTDSVQNYVGDRAWSTWSNVIWDNLWVSAFVVSLLFSYGTPPPNMLDKVGGSIILMLGVSTLSWTARWGAYKGLSTHPATAGAGAWVAPKM